MATTGCSSSIRRQETLWHYGEIERRKGAVAEQLTELRETKSTTRDGRHIVLSANIELPDEVGSSARATARKASAFIARNFSTSTAPRCRPRRNNTRLIGRSRSKSRPHPLIIRTFDLGGDKIAGRH